MQLMDLSRVPPPAVVETLDYETIRAAMLADFTARWPEYTAALESDPAVKLIEAAAYRELLLRARINDAARAGMLAAAGGTDLDNLAARYNTERQSGESDGSLRARAQIGLHQLAAAGSRERFRWHALDSHADIIQADAWTVTTGAVGVSVLSRVQKERLQLSAEEIALGEALFGELSGGLSEYAWVVAASDEAPVQAARSRLLSDPVAPLGCNLLIQDPDIATYTVQATIVIPPGPDPATVLANAQTALAAYLDQVTAFRIDATRAGVIAALFVQDARDVLLTEPAADIPRGAGQIAVCTAVSVQLEVRDD